MGTGLSDLQVEGVRARARGERVHAHGPSRVGPNLHSVDARTRRTRPQVAKSI